MLFRYLQAGSYPVIDPENGHFPDKMRPMGRYHNITFNPENGVHNLMVPSPNPGHWFMFAFAQERKFQDLAQQVRKSEAEKLLVNIWIAEVRCCTVSRWEIFCGAVHVQQCLYNVMASLLSYWLMQCSIVTDRQVHRSW